MNCPEEHADDRMGKGRKRKKRRKVKKIVNVIVEKSQKQCPPEHISGRHSFRIRVRSGSGRSHFEQGSVNFKTRTTRSLINAYKGIRRGGNRRDLKGGFRKVSRSARAKGDVTYNGNAGMIIKRESSQLKGQFMDYPRIPDLDQRDQYLTVSHTRRL